MGAQNQIFKKNSFIVDGFRTRKVLVFGDLILDRYIWGQVGRISPEAPVPVVEVTDEYFAVGGAANVAHNIVSLGGSATVVGIVGNDLFGRIFKEQLDEKNIRHVLFEDERQTTLKTRVIAHNQQVVRIDREEKERISGPIIGNVLKYLKYGVLEHDAVIVSDYNKGMISRDIVKEIIRVAKRKKKFVGVDPKFQNHEYFNGASLIKRNLMEASRCSGVNIIDEQSLFKAARILINRLSCKTSLITRGADGMSLFEKGRVVNIPSVARRVYDVTGAGDTVIATFTLAHLSGASNEEAACIANHAAGLVVGEVGTAVTTSKKLLRSLSVNGNLSIIHRFLRV